MSRDYYLRWLTTSYEDDSSVDKPSYAKEIKQEIPEIAPVKKPPVEVERKKAQVHTVDHQEKFIEKDGFSVVVDNEGQIITDMQLLAHLRGLRAQISKEEKRAAYTIISNKGLVSLATYRPATKEEFVSLYGLGETTYQSFGIKFITAIKDFYNQS
jgi:superfamily II DNA helicase RecQ